LVILLVKAEMKESTSKAQVHSVYCLYTITVTPAQGCAEFPILIAGTIQVAAEQYAKLQSSNRNCGSGCDCGERAGTEAVSPTSIDCTPWSHMVNRDAITVDSPLICKRELTDVALLHRLAPEAAKGTRQSALWVVGKFP
jgi:hypothetical protein